MLFCSRMTALHRQKVQLSELAGRHLNLNDTPIGVQDLSVIVWECHGFWRIASDIPPPPSSQTYFEERVSEHGEASKP